MFSNILKNCVGKTSRHIENSIDFKNKIKDLNIPRNYKLFSLDVISLFTNIPINLVICVIEKRWQEIKKYTTIPKNIFIEGIKIVTNNCYFSYDNTTYHQIFGTPMGSPISPVLAELILEDLEETVLSQISNNNIQILFYCRYVDDCFIIFNPRHLQTILNKFNSYSEKLQFTYEEEDQQQSLPYLEVKITRTSNHLKINWYQKPTWSGRYLNYSSYLPSSYKKNTVSLMTRKIIELSDPEYHETNFDLMERTLMKNNYPRYFIKRLK